jgi:hypothetical protein
MSYTGCVPVAEGGVVTAGSDIESYRDLLAANPHTGTTEQVVTLSLGIADAAEALDRTAFGILRDESGINSKVFSKLKVIGKTLKEIDDKKRGEVIKGLPPSYSTIHLLCALKPEELVTAVKSDAVDRNMSVRAAEAYVKQVRFPRLAVINGEKQDWETKEEMLFGIHCPDSVLLSMESIKELEESLRNVCSDYGVFLRQAGDKSTTALKKIDSAKKEFFWRSILERELPLQWFQKAPEELKKQFNIRTHEELLNTPLRSFTGFLVNAEGGRSFLWEKHGRAYIAKLHLEREKTDDRSQRHNLKRRIDEVLGERKELAIWRNIMVKENGFI